MNQQQRGFTLLEFMVATGIAGIVTLGVLDLLRNQIAGYDRQQRVQDAQIAVRQGMDTIVNRVTVAGFGLPPEYLIGSNSANNRAVIGASPDMVCAGTDVLELRTRNPLGFWKTSGATAAALNIRKPAVAETEISVAASNGIVRNGQSLFVFASPGNYALVKSAATATISSSSATVPIALSANTESAKLATLTLSDSEVLPVTTSRFFLSCVDLNHPKMMLDEGIDSSGDGVIDSPILIADEIEDLQVAYLLDTNQDGVLSTTEVSGAVNVVSASQYPQIKAIRVSLVGRSSTVLFRGTTNLTVSAPMNVEDHTPGLPADQLARRLLQQTILLDNRNTDQGVLYNHFSSRYL